MVPIKSRERLKKDFLKNRIPIALDELVYQRFPEKQVIFSRVNWDSSFNAFGAGISDRQTEKVGLKGYSRVEYAVNAASWTVHDHLAMVFKQNEEQDSQQDSPTQLTCKLPKYEYKSLQTNTNLIKRLGQMFGAYDVGICEIGSKKHFVYSHDKNDKEIILPEGVEYAIVMIVEMDYQAIMNSPRLPASITTGDGYSRIAFAVASVAETLRNLGYKAIPSVNSMGPSVPLAVQAGLGQFGRNGLLIHPKIGQRLRIGKVFTDFPMVTDSPINFGATEICRVCKKCAKLCPSRSIPEDEPTWESSWNIPSNNNGVFKWYVNAETCYEFWVKNSSDCSNCIRACPFTKAPGIAHDLARFFINHFRFLSRFWVWLDDLMGYGKNKDPAKFWRFKTYLGKKISHKNKVSYNDLS
ncbi:MAG: reductive dehalogenase [Candidatus Hodarchaeota archaeon]